MAEPKVSILLQLIDKVSQPVEGVKGSLDKLGKGFKNLGNEAMELLNNKLVQGVGLAGLGAGLMKAFEAADTFRVALQKLEGTAKITGVPLETLQEIAGKAETAFGLSKAQASDFAVEMAKLATKAGDVGKAGPALQSFLDIGAARGLTAQETLKAVQQAILGIDEGTDKLFNANPSVLYERFAESIGTTAGKLTDQEKAQALLTAAMEDGGKVVGQYGAYLETTAGQTQLAKNQTEAFLAELGQSLDPARRKLMEFVAALANGARDFVGGVQLLGAEAANFFLGIPDKFTVMWGKFLIAIANSIGESRVLLTIFGDGITGVADKLGKSGTDMVRISSQNLRNLKAGYDETVSEIVGVVQAGEGQQTAATKQGGTLRLASTKATAKATEQEVAASHKKLADLEELAYRAQLQGLTAQQREYLELVRTFHAKMEGMTAEDRAKAEQLLSQAHQRLIVKWAGLDKELKPVMREIGMTLKGPILDFGNTVDATVPAAGEKWDRFRTKAQDAAYSVRDAAFDMADFARQVGVADQQMLGLVEGIGQLADGIGGIASGNLIGGIATAVVGLQGIVGTLFGDSPAERARKELLRKNTVALEKLRDSVGDLERTMSPGSTIAAFQGIGESQRNQLIGTADALKTFGGVDRQQLGRQLGSLGLTFGQFEQLAKDMGLDIGTGRISGDVLRQFFAGLADFEPNRVGQGFNDQRRFLDEYAEIAGMDPVEQLRRLATLGGGQSDFLKNIFESADLSSEAGRADLRSRLQTVFGQLGTGEIGVGQFGQLSGQEFRDFITDFVSRLTGITGTTTGAPAAPPVTTGVTSTGIPGSVSTTGNTDTITTFTQIEVNTRRSAEILEAWYARATGGTGSPGTTGAIDETLAVFRDLSNASQGVA